MDQKLAYSEYPVHIQEKITNRTKLIRRLKGLKLKNQEELSLIINNTLICSILDYAFIPIISPCLRIAAEKNSLDKPERLMFIS